MSKVKKIITLLICSSFMGILIAGCLISNNSKDESNNPNPSLVSFIPLSFITDSLNLTEALNLYQGQSISKQSNQIEYIQDSLYYSKSLKITDTKVTSFLTRVSDTSSRVPYHIEDTDITGTWVVYKQIHTSNAQNEYYLDVDDKNNRATLNITRLLSGWLMIPKQDGIPIYLSDQAALIRNAALLNKAKLAWDIETLKCNRTDLDFTHQVECIQWVSNCSPTSNLFKPSLCNVNYNPCNNTQWTTIDRAQCVVQYAACSPGGELYASSEKCMVVFIPNNEEASSIVSGFLGGGSDGKVAESQLVDLFAGDPIQVGDFSLYYIKDIYADKVFKVKDKTDKTNIIVTYFALPSTLAKNVTAKNLDLTNDGSDLEGTWRAYKQTQNLGESNEEDFFIDTEDNDNKIELIVLISDKDILWKTKTTGTPVFLSAKETVTEKAEIDSTLSANIVAAKNECDARKDYTADQITLCKEKVEACAPGSDSVGTQFCVLEDYNPCDRPDLTEAEKAACIEKVEACALGGEKYGTHDCYTFFDPCDESYFTAAQRTECRYTFEFCGPGGDSSGTAFCETVFSPCEGLVDIAADSSKGIAADSSLTECLEIEKRCHADNFDPALDKEFCADVLDPCNIPGLTNEIKEQCRALSSKSDCSNPENFENPECQITFDPCTGLTPEEENKCRIIEDRCGPQNLSPTSEEVAFCSEQLNPCTDPILTAIQRAQCNDQWKKCGPGGTHEGTPECF